MPPDTPLLVDAALAVTALVFVAAFTLLWRVNAKVGELYVVLCEPRVGVVRMLEKLTERVEGLAERVSDLERD